MPYSKVQILDFLARAMPIVHADPDGFLMMGPYEGKVGLVLEHERPDLVDRLLRVIPADALEVEIRPGGRFATM